MYGSSRTVTSQGMASAGLQKMHSLSRDESEEWWAYRTVKRMWCPTGGSMIAKNETGPGGSILNSIKKRERAGST